MQTTPFRIGLLALVSSAIAAWGLFQPATIQADEQDRAGFQAEFFRLCDIACKELNKELTPFTERTNVDPTTHHVPFFEDSHAVRALAVGYDMTGKKEYLEACQRWSDRMIAFQNRMVPKGAYYLNYFRKPGETRGDWFVSDASSVAMGVLATAVRSPQKADRDRYLRSVKSYAELVMRDRIGKDGGIIEVLWGGFRDSWWCSTGTFGSLAFLLYEETGEERYLKVASGALGWMIGRDFREATVITFQQRPSGVVFYDFQSYAAGVKYLPAGSKERKAAMGQISEALKWMATNQVGRGGKPPWRYLDDGHTDMAALPFLMYAFAHQLPEHRDLTAAADRELRYVAGLLLDKGDPPVSQLKVWELASWGMMSYAEKLSPGSLLRSSRRP